MTPARRRLFGVIGLVLLLAVGGIAAWQIRGARERAAIAASVPPTPDLTAKPAELQRRIAAATDAAVAGDASALAELSRLYHANGYYREALECYVGLQAARPNEPLWLHRAAHVYAVFGDSESAGPLLEAVVATAPDYLPARIKLGEVLYKDNALDEAEAVLAAVLEKDAANVHAQIGLARIDIARGDWTAARPRLERVATRTKGEYGADLLTTVYQKLGEDDRARLLRSQQKAHGAYQAVSDPWINVLNDDCYDAYQLALESGAAAYRGDDDDAVRWINRALQLDPEDGQLHHQAARIWERLRNQVKALSAYEKAVELDPTISDAWMRLITLYKAIGETGKAFTALRQALEANPDSGVLLIERGRSFQERGRLEQALADFRRVTEVRHDDATGFVEAARVLFALERVQEGQVMLERSLEAEPENPFALIMLTFAAISAQDRPAADRWFRRLDAQPRVTPQDRARLAAGYQQVFGAAPP